MKNFKILLRLCFVIVDSGFFFYRYFVFVSIFYIYIYIVCCQCELSNEGASHECCAVANRMPCLTTTFNTTNYTYVSKFTTTRNGFPVETCRNELKSEFLIWIVCQIHRRFIGTRIIFEKLS